MGVISKDKLQEATPVRSSLSEETLYIPTSDDDQSEASASLRFAQVRSSAGRRNRAPTLKNESGPPPTCGKKKFRRHQNASVLLTLAEEDDGEITIDDFVNNLKTPFSPLFEDEQSFQKWEDFVTSNEERQNEIIAPKSSKSKPAEVNQQQSHHLNPILKNLIRRKNLPFGMIEYLEAQVVSFFRLMPRDIFISTELSSFERLLLHSLSDYHALQSLSFNAEPKKVRLVKIKNPRDNFVPAILLTEYLSSL